MDEAQIGSSLVDDRGVVGDQQPSFHGKKSEDLSRQVHWSIKELMEFLGMSKEIR